MSESGKTVESILDQCGYELKHHDKILQVDIDQWTRRCIEEALASHKAEVDGLKKQALTLSKQIVENGKREHEATELAINFQSQLSVARSNYQETVDDLRSQLTAAHSRIEKLRGAFDKVTTALFDGDPVATQFLPNSAASKMQMAIHECH